MNQRRHIAVIAACATLMAALPLTSLFEFWTWFLQSALLIAMICAATVGARGLRAPVWLQPIVGLVVLAFGVTWLYGHGHAYGGVIPDADTARYLTKVTSHLAGDLSDYATPAPDVASFLFVAGTSVALCAIVIDLLAVGLRRPALAGLPMLGMYVVASEVNTHDVPILTFIVAAAGYLWLLVSDSIDRVRAFGRRFTGDGRSMDLWESSPLAATGRWIAVAGVAVALLIPAIFPGVGAGLVHQPSSGLGGTGDCTNVCSGGVNMFAALRGQLNETQTFAELSVSTDETSPSQYLRLGVATQLSKAGFASTPSSGTPLGAGAINIRNPDAPRHNATVTIDDLAVGLLPIYLDPDVTSFQGVSDDWAFDASTETAFSRNVTRHGMTYQFAYYASQPTADDLRASAPLAPTSPLLSLATVPQDLPLVDEIVKQQTADTNSEYDAVRALENYLTPENGFAYSLTTKIGTSGSDIIDFLTNKQGFCVQYAATLAWLVRADHYPARVAFGFLGGTRESDGQTYLMTNHDLHAWTEVYFPGYGWVPFDPTPGVSHKILAEYEQAGTGANPTPSADASAVSGGVHIRPTESGGPATAGGTSNNGSTGELGWAMWVLVGVVVVLLVAATPAAARVMRRRQRSATDRATARAGGGRDAPPGEPWIEVDHKAAAAALARRVHAAWDEFQDTLVDFDVPIDPAESPAAACERVVRTTDLTEAGRGSVRTIGRAEQLARYARRPDPVGPLEDDLRRFRRELGDNVPFTTRLRANLLPPSVVGAWRAAVASRLSRVRARVGGGWEGMARALHLSTLLARPRKLLAGRSTR